MSTPTKKKRRIMVKAKLLEISAVDKPAQSGARMVLRKRDEEDDDQGHERPVSEPTSEVAEAPQTQAELAQTVDYERMVEAAESVAKGLAYGRLFSHLTRDDFQAAQIEYVRRHMQKGETEARATVRLMNDATVQLLDKAWRETQNAREAKQADAYSKARAEGRELPQARKHTSAGYVTKAEIEEQLRKVAEATRRPSETTEQAYARTLEAHPELYRAYREASD